MAAAPGTRSTRFEGATVVLMDAGAFSDGKAFFEGMRCPGPAALIGTRASGTAVVWMSAAASASAIACTRGVI